MAPSGRSNFRGKRSARREPSEFWNAHFPVMHSVKTGYAHFSIEKGTQRIVHVGVVAESFSELLDLAATDDQKLRADI